MFERFTQPARDVVVRAQWEARSLGHGQIGTEVLLLSLLAESEGVASEVLAEAGITYAGIHDQLRRIVGGDVIDPDALKSVGIDFEQVRDRVEASFGAGALDGGGTDPKVRGHIPFTAAAKKTLELALREAISPKNKHIGTEHILLGLTHDLGGMVDRMLAAQGVRLPALRDRLRTRLRATA